MQYDMTARIMFLMFKKPVFSYLETVYGKKETNVLKKKSKHIYRKMLGRTPGVGGIKENAVMTRGLLMAAILFSIYKAADGRMTEEVFAKMTDALGHSPILKKVYSKKDAFSKKEHAEKLREAAVSQKANYSMGWKFTHEVRANEYFTTYTKCGVCELAKKESCFHLVKYICLIDYITIDLMGCKLERTKTIANGDDICNFHVTKK